MAEISKKKRLPLFFSGYDTWYRLRLFRIFLNSINYSPELKIADIGGGEAGLERLLKIDTITIIDNNDQSVNEASRWVKNAIKSTGETIDLPDNSYDWTISFHTIEHVPEKDREKFISEMIRISSKGLYLNFPFGESSRQLCENYLKSLKKNEMEPNKWTVEHLHNGLPDLKKIEKILEKQNKFRFSMKTVRNYYIENLYWKLSVSKWVLVRGINRFAIPLLSYFFSGLEPGIEVVIIGSSNDSLNYNILSKI